jgi:hypothetical protein
LDRNEERIAQTADQRLNELANSITGQPEQRNDYGIQQPIGVIEQREIEYT